MSNLKGNVYFNDNIFEYGIIDILVDIARLKHFHDISNVNYIKFIAYTASWCIKRKPFQLIDGCDQKFLYINECFALTILLQASGYIFLTCYNCYRSIRAYRPAAIYIYLDKFISVT